MTFQTQLIPIVQAVLLAAGAQQDPVREAERPSLTRAGRHAIELGVGVAGGTTASISAGPGGATTEAGTAVSGALSYSYWIAERVAITAQVGVASVDATVSSGTTSSSVRSATVVPLLFGAKYQPFSIAGAERLRPYLSGAIGPFIGTDAGVGTQGGTATVGSRTEVALGGRIGAGLDLLVSRRVMLGVGAGYRLMADFAQPIGGDRNYSGADFVLSVGVLLGGGR